MAGWYRGDCHLHSTYSHGGELTPAQLAAAARAAGLDFVAATEHNTADAHDEWAGQATDWQYGVEDGPIDRHLDAVHRAGGLCVVAHPYAPYPTGTFEYPYQGFDAVEVWNGQWSSDLPWNADNEAGLADWAARLTADVHDGNWRPAIGNSDTHLAGQIGIPHTVVRADEFTATALLAGIAAGHSWITGSTDIDLSLTVSAGDRRAGIGERLDTGGAPATVRVEVRGVPSGAISFHTDRGTAYQVSLSADGAGSARWRTSAAQSAFVRVEIRHPDGQMAALTNPITLI
ncbi:CehA/McbA family metallohydrolase [Micromonospora sp. NBC_01813]|uniref:CehA/McbA family metallohydrolase n=1 Tax=Micromonospora sp. NBC_01813 TaxID=2975988 RepID=UPI002DD7BEE4|nr:CehA/McbA family metallohydrolase [Micromonospora sp. NBC_01813]WSA09175.1 CehA/McbA family metallohydrolase [Micromonospora sp. NBC_01813]